tara:strand:+ start:231 stop:419 length:189 start_codon:yes stop_codon:yes gene_type:complete
MKKETIDITLGGFECNDKQVYKIDDVEIEGNIPTKLYLCAEAEESYITEVNLTKVTENCGCN